MIEHDRPHAGAEIFSTSQASEITGVPIGTIGSWKGRGKFTEPDHCFKNPDDNKLYWTAAGIQLIRDLDRDANAPIASVTTGDGATVINYGNSAETETEQALPTDGDVPTLDQFADEMAAAIAKDIVWGEIRRRIPSAITREIVRLLSLPEAKREFAGITAEWISPLQSQALDSAVRIQMIQASSNGHHKALTGVRDA